MARRYQSPWSARAACCTLRVASQVELGSPTAGSRHPATPGVGSVVQEDPAAQSQRIRRQDAVGSVRDVHLSDLAGLTEVDVDMKWVPAIRRKLLSVWQFDVLLAPIGCQQDALAVSDNAEVDVIRCGGHPHDDGADRTQRYPDDDTTHANPPLRVDLSDDAS